MKKVEIGNPQEIRNVLSEAEWGWLAGLIDGEGCIAMNIRRKKVKEWNGSGIDLRVSLGNTDAGIIQRFVQLLERLGIQPFLNEVQPGEQKHSMAKKSCVYATLGRMTDIYKFLANIRQHLAGEKRARAELVMRFIERRKTHQGPVTKKGASWFVENDWQIVRDFYVLCRKPLPEQFQKILRDYTRSEPKVA